MQRYLEVTKDPKLIEEEKWKNIQDELENAEEEPECLIIGEPSKLAHISVNDNAVTPIKD